MSPSGPRRRPKNADRAATSREDRGQGGLQVPGGAREPIGRDRASRPSNAPPRRPRHTQKVPARPAFPEDETPQIPRSVSKEIERLLGRGAKSHDIALALSIGSSAIDEDRIDVALEVLSWAKYEAPKLAAVREAYGVALYLGEDFAAALTELQAYRRLTGRNDQNHLIADSLRAIGRGTDMVAATAEELVSDPQAPEDRRVEAVIVWAASLADAGNVQAARGVVRRFLERPRSGDAEHDLRLRIVAADLAERAGDDTELARQLEHVVAVDPSFMDASQRLDALTAEE